MTRIGIISDVHLAPRGEPAASWHGVYDFQGSAGRVSRALEVFKEASVDGLLVLGDLTHRGDEDSVAEVLALLDQARCDVWYAWGNHDGPRRRAGPSQGVLADGLRVAVLEIERTPSGFRSCAPLHVESWHDDLTLLASHFPVVSREAELTARGYAYAGDLEDQEALCGALVSRRAPTIAVCGHLHVRDACARASLLQLYSAAVVEAPFECSLLELERSPGATRLTLTAVALGPAPSADAPVFVPDVQVWEFDGVWSPTEPPPSRTPAPPPPAPAARRSPG